MEPKLVNMSPMYLISAAGSFLNFLAPLLKADDEFIRFIIRIVSPVLIPSLSVLSYIVLDLPLPHLKSPFLEYPTVKVYLDTAIVVVISYATLLMINVRFIVLAVFPFIALAFIAALCVALVRAEADSGGDPGASSSASSAAATDHKGKKTTTTTTTEEAEQLTAMSVVPYWVLCATGHVRAKDLAVTQFLLFLSATLGALMLMLMRLRLHAGVATGVAPASELLRKASLVALLVTVHTMAAELLGENVVLLCVPELVPALIWSSLHLDRSSTVITVERIKSNRNGLVFLGAGAVAGFGYLAASMDERGVSRCAMTSVSCGVSGVLVYYGVFMLRQWPAHGTAKATVSCLEEAVQLLKFWADALLLVAAALLVPTSLAAVRLLHEQARFLH